MQWNVNLRAKAIKQARKLPTAVNNSLIALIRDIEESGPVRGKWPNYSKLGGNRHHCDLKKGQPTYVAI